MVKISGLRFRQCLDAERPVHHVRQPPGEHLSARPVHDRDQIKEAPPHWQVGDVRTLDLVQPRDLQIAQQVRIDAMLRVRIARPSALIDWRKPHRRRMPVLRHTETIKRHRGAPVPFCQPLKILDASQIVTVRSCPIVPHRFNYTICDAQMGGFGSGRIVTRTPVSATIGQGTNRGM